MDFLECSLCNGRRGRGRVAYFLIQHEVPTAIFFGFPPTVVIVSSLWLTAICLRKNHRSVMQRLATVRQSSGPDDANELGAVLLGLLVAIASPQIRDAWA